MNRSVSPYRHAAFALLLAAPLPATADALADSRDCVIGPYEVVDVSSAVPGLLEAVAVERSDSVRSGQLLARLESRVEQASLELAEAWASIDSEVRLEQTNGALDQRRHERISRLLANKAVALDDQDRAETEARLSALRVRQAREKVWIRELDAAKARAAIARREVRSPIDGVVVERYRAAGEYVENQPIVRVARLDPLQVETILPMARFGEVQAGMVAEVSTENAPGESLRAVVHLVDRMGDAASGTFSVRLTLPNPAGRIPAGIKCRMRLLPGERAPVPAAAAGAPTTPPPAAAPQPQTLPAPVPPQRRPAAAAAARRAALPGPAWTTVAPVQTAGELTRGDAPGNGAEPEKDVTAPADAITAAEAGGDAPVTTTPVPEVARTDTTTAREAEGGAPAATTLVAEIAPAGATTAADAGGDAPVTTTPVPEVARKDTTTAREAEGGAPTTTTLVAEIAPADATTAGEAEGDAPAATTLVAEIALADATTAAEAEGDAPSTIAPVAEVARADAPATPAAGVGVPAATGVVPALAGGAGFAASRCSAIGPLDDADDARALAESVAAAGARTRVESESVIERAGFIVVTPAQDGVEAAKRVAEGAMAAGVRDLQVLGRGEYAHRVSLGVFVRASTAAERRDRVAALGIDAEVLERKRRREQWWVHVSGEPGAGALPAALPGTASVSAIDCPPDPAPRAEVVAGAGPAW